VRTAGRAADLTGASMVNQHNCENATNTSQIYMHKQQLNMEGNGEAKSIDHQIGHGFTQTLLQKLKQLKMAQ